MCGRFTLATDRQILSDHFGSPIPEITPRYNISPTQEILIIRKGGVGLEPAIARWGLIPCWATAATQGPPNLNARAETVAEKPTFRAAFRWRRCLIPADGFYEWRKEGAAKVPIRFAMRGGGTFAFAGLWECWERGAGPIESTAVITTGPNEVVAPIHDRMPAILRPEDYEEWLDPGSDPRGLIELLRPFDADQMVALAASRRVNSAKNEGPDLLVEAA